MICACGGWLIASADGWESVGNGKLTLVDGHGQFHGMASGDLVRRPLALDFRRRPVLEMRVPSTATKWSMFLTDGKQTLDLVRKSAYLAKNGCVVDDGFAHNRQCTIP